MVRFLVLSCAVVLTVLAAPAIAEAATINVTGKLSNGAYVQIVCTADNGQFSGTGVLFGTNPANGSMYKYPFVIIRGSTAPGQIILSGTFAGTNYPVTVTASVPNGPLTFTYVVNGKTYTLTGVGIVTVN